MYFYSKLSEGRKGLVFFFILISAEDFSGREALADIKSLAFFTKKF